MMMKAAPATALEMVEPELILELLIVALDAPTQLGEADEVGDGRGLRQGREPILRGLGFAPRPLDQQPLGPPGLRTLLIAMGGPHAQPREARAHRAARPFAPRHRPPRRRRPRAGQLLAALRGVSRGAPPVRGGPAATLPALRGPRRLAWRPGRRLLFHADDVRQPRGGERLAKCGRVAVARIREHGGRRHAAAGGRPPSSPAGKADRQPAGSRPRSPPTRSPPLGSCPVCPRRRSTAGPRPPSAGLSWETRCRPRSTRPRDPAGPSAPPPTPARRAGARRRPRAHRRRSGASTGAGPGHAADRRVPPLAQR